MFVLISLVKVNIRTFFEDQKTEKKPMSELFLLSKTNIKAP